MRKSSLVWIFLTTGCGGLPVDETAGSNAPSDATAPVVERDAFVRVKGEDVPPSLDSVYLECDADAWRVVAEVIGRASSVRTTVVRTRGAPLAFDVRLDGPTDLPPEAVFQPFQHLIEDPATPCDTEGVSVVVEALDGDGAVVDCVAWGQDVAGVLGGTHDARLGDVRRGDWKACRTR